MVLYFDPLHFNPSDTNSVLGALQYVYGNMDTSTFENASVLSMIRMLRLLR